MATDERESPSAFQFRPIGRVRSSFVEKADAPRQPSETREHRAVLEIFPAYRDAQEGLGAFSHIWVVFVFDRALGFSGMKVSPPRSSEKLGSFATRSPHRPNPIGLSALKLLSIEGTLLHVEGADLLDGTPVLDIKPYLAYTDAITEASAGWVGEEADRARRYEVRWSPRADEQLRWLTEQGHAIGSTVQKLLSTGPHPHAYRRIRVKSPTISTLAYKSWRFDFSVQALDITVESIASGYRPKDLERGDEGPAGLDAHALHRLFLQTFPDRSETA